MKTENKYQPCPLDTSDIHLPEELLPQLTKPAWIRLLGYYPEFAEKCKSDIFSSENWCSILLQQPSLGTFLPSNIIFSDSEKERLKKINFFHNMDEKSFFAWIS